MKKFICSLLLVVLFAFPFAGCSTNSTDDDWVEVQSITYTMDSAQKTYTSTYKYDITAEEIEQAEYDNAPLEYKFKIQYLDDVGYEHKMDSNRADFLTNAKRLLSNPSYFLLDGYAIYYKVTYNSYKIKYVKIKLNKDGTVEIKYDDEYKKILPTSY